jgi:hypothetical protein
MTIADWPVPMRQPNAVVMRLTCMSRNVRRWPAPLLAAVAVLAVLAVMWHQRSGGSGVETGVAVAPGGDASDARPPYPASTPEGRSLDTPIPIPDLPSPPKPARPVPAAVLDDMVAVDSYHQYDARHLALNYSIGVPECYGTAGTPRVEQTPEAVVVTIPRIPPKPGDDDTACIEIAVLLSVDIVLDEPLGDRPVLDGARDRASVPETVTAYPGGPG